LAFGLGLFFCGFGFFCGFLTILRVPISDYDWSCFLKAAKKKEYTKNHYQLQFQKNDCFKEMQKITILDKSFFDSKKNQSCKTFGDTTFHLSKKRLSRKASCNTETGTLLIFSVDVSCLF